MNFKPGTLIRCIYGKGLVRVVLGDDGDFMTIYGFSCLHEKYSTRRIMKAYWYLKFEVICVP